MVYETFRLVENTLLTITYSGSTWISVKCAIFIFSACLLLLFFSISFYATQSSIKYNMETFYIGYSCLCFVDHAFSLFRFKSMEMVNVHWNAQQIVKNKNLTRKSQGPWLGSPHPACTHKVQLEIISINLFKVYSSQNISIMFVATLKHR